jgi:hypothetical protein
MDPRSKNDNEMGELGVTYASTIALSDVEGMYLAGIGSLVQKDDVWRLTYALCGHVQDLVSYGVEWGTAAADVRRDYARCLICASARSRQALAPRPSFPKT